MKRDAAIGAIFGVLFFFVNRLNKPGSLDFDAGTIAEIIGAMIGGIFLYMLASYFLSKKK